MSTRTLLAASLATLALGFPTHAQDEPMLHPVAWDWKPVSELHDSIVMVSLGDATATGVVVQVDEHKPIRGGHEGYCLTALHVVEEDNDARKIKVTYKNGRRAKNCRVAYADEENDLALLWVWVPDGVNAVPVAEHAAVPGELLEFSGLGGGEDIGCCLRNFTGYASDPTKPHVIFANVSLLPGDSGGPIFNKERDLVGIISGGWFWWNGGAKSTEGYSLQTTWPTRGANVSAVQSLLARVDTCDKCEDTKESLALSKPPSSR